MSAAASPIRGRVFLSMRTHGSENPTDINFTNCVPVMVMGVPFTEVLIFLFRPGLYAANVRHVIAHAN